MQFSIAAKTFGSLALAAVLAAPVAGVAQSQTSTHAAPATKLSDAQVEANVLKALAADDRLASQSINTSTVFGTVTLTGSVADDALRGAADQIAARVDGVKKVVDQLTVGGATTAQADPAAANNLPSDGSAMSVAQGRAMAAAHPQQDPESGNLDPNAPPQQGYAQQDPYGEQQNPQYAQQPGDGQQPSQPYGGGGQPPQYGDPNGYPLPGQQNGPSQPPQHRLYHRDYERQMAQGGNSQGTPQGQPGGVPVTIPDGTDLPVRINRWLSSGDAAPGSTFEAFVSSDILAGGQIAIPRGATVEGTVIDAKGAGVLKGRGELTLQLTALNLGGQRIPLQSAPFTVNGHDKGARSINSTLLGGAVGALFGAAIGGGTGAAVGAGIGGAAGLGSAAASNSGNVNLPAEALLHFRLTAPMQVTTVSEAEMQRLGGYAGPASAYRRGPGPYAHPYPAVGVYAYPAYPYPYRYYRHGYWY